jgi:hypothetical protein
MKTEDWQLFAIPAKDIRPFPRKCPNCGDPAGEAQVKISRSIKTSTTPSIGAMIAFGLASFAISSLAGPDKAEVFRVNICKKCRDRVQLINVLGGMLLFVCVVVGIVALPHLGPDNVGDTSEAARASRIPIVIVFFLFIALVVLVARGIWAIAQQHKGVVVSTFTDDEIKCYARNSDWVNEVKRTYQDQSV